MTFQMVTGYLHAPVRTRTPFWEALGIFLLRAPPIALPCPGPSRNPSPVVTPGADSSQNDRWISTVSPGAHSHGIGNIFYCPQAAGDPPRSTPLISKPHSSQLSWIEFYDRMKVRAFGTPCFGTGILYRKGQYVGGTDQLFFFPLRVRAKEVRSNYNRRDAS